jgi:hypothetical protein
MQKIYAGKLLQSFDAVETFEHYLFRDDDAEITILEGLGCIYDLLYMLTLVIFCASVTIVIQ